MKSVSARSVGGVILCALVFFFEAPQGWGSNSLYLQTNLVSDIPGIAQSTDPNLRNPWGVSFSTVSPFWVSNAASNTTTLYSGTGSTVVSLVAGIPGGPTGQVQNPTTGFLLSNGKPANFIFDVMAGSIYAWNTDSGPTAEQVATVPYMSFTGLALANNGSGYFLYAANSAGTVSIEVFDSTFTHTTLSGAFKDPSIPAGYVPYNVQAISGQLYVEYANFQQNKGAVSIFDMNGTFIKELIAAGGPQLNLPWGVVIAPAGFGGFAANQQVGSEASEAGRGNHDAPG